MRTLKPGQTLPKGALVLSRSSDAHPAEARGKQDREAGAPRRVRGGVKTPVGIKQQQLMFERTTGVCVCVAELVTKLYVACGVGGVAAVACVAVV